MCLFSPPLVTVCTMAVMVNMDSAATVATKVPPTEITMDPLQVCGCIYR